MFSPYLAAPFVDVAVETYGRRCANCACVATSVSIEWVPIPVA